MSQTEASGAASVPPDLLEHLATIQAGSALATLRAQRTDVARYSQGSYDALLEPDDPAGVSRIERESIALRVAILNQSAPLIEHYRQRLSQSGVPASRITAIEHFHDNTELTPREAALLRHTDLLTNEPHSATPSHLAELQAVDLSTRDIVTIAQLIAFLSFQVRLLAGLQALGGAA
jgi:CMD domain protein